MSNLQPGPGWYPDPQNSNNQRYWDGQNWTSNIAPAGANPQNTVANSNFNNPIPTTSGNAIASLVTSFFCGPLGVIFGHIAISEIDKSNGLKTGKGLAIAGLVIGYASLAIGFLVLVAGA